VASREFAPFEMYSASAFIYLLIVSVLIRISYLFEHRIFAP